MEVNSNGRYFRVFIVFFLLQQSLGCQDSPVGIADSSIIPDNRFTATSEYDSRYVPKNARLNGAAKGWGPRTEADPDDYLQIDLGEVFVICAVATQGCRDYNEWTKQYKISTSVDNNIWTNYTDGNTDKLFTGNTDRNTVVKNVLDVPTLARYIRFIPTNQGETSYYNWKVLRVEAYGLKKSLLCRSVPVGIGNGKIPDSNMTSSSTYNSTTSPSKARLGYTAGSSWCAATSDSSPYLQINLGSPYIICGIATQGDHMTDQWIQSYQITESTDGTTFNKYMENSQVKSFDGNFDSNTVVNNVLYDGTIGQYIRVTPTSHYGTTNCMRTELYGIKQTGGCRSMPVGLSYSSIIPDHRFTASTHFSGYNPSYARLVTSNRAWTSSAPSVVDWLQIDLGSVVYVCAVATQGFGALAKEWATRYKIRVSIDNVIWNYYQENNIDKVFIGNTDRYTVVKRDLLHPVRTKFIRFHPTAYNSYPSMRVEVYGISTACNSPVGLEDPGVIQNDRMTSSSDFDNTHTASHGRLYGSTSWCSSTSSNTEYIQINLEQVMTVTGIATQGDHTMDKWVKTYTISYSMDGNLWNTYKAGMNTSKVLQGNTDRSSIVVRWLSHPLTARHVRVTPQTWNTARCMRMELYGCNYATRPVISGLTNQNLTAAANSYVDLVCIVQEPLIQYIKWYTGNTDITSQSTGLVSGVNGVTSMLRIDYTSVDDVLNTYDCFRSNFSVLCFKPLICRAMYGNVASDEDGIKSAGVKIRYDYTMTTPTVDNIQSTSVRVNWTKPVLTPSQAAITSYVLQYQNSSYTQTLNVPLAAVFHIITGLAIFTNYSVKIRAVSKVGQGEWSQARHFTTDSALPVVSPALVRSNALTSQSIRVTWQTPTSGVNGPLLGYRLSYSPVSGSIKYININAGQTSYDITSLNKWTVYRVTVKCYNDKGDGPASAEVVVRTLEDAPSAPTNLQTTEIAPNGSTGPQVKLTWDPPSSPNGIIQYYIVLYNYSQGLPAVYKTNVTGVLTITLPVFGGKTYWFSVKAVTIKEGNQRTKEVAVQVYAPTTAPKASDQFSRPVQHNATTFTVQWEPVNAVYGPVTIYELFLYAETKSSRSKRALPAEPLKINATCCNATFYKLPPCSTYSIPVRAYTSAGPGPFSTPIKLLTSEPPPPSNLAITDAGKREVTLQWKDPPSLTKHVEEYKISFNGTNLYDVKIQIPDDTKTTKDKTTTVSNLHPATRYMFQVSAKTECGVGKKSNQAEVDTKVDAPPAPEVERIGSITASTNNVTLWKASNRNGPIWAYQVVVIEVIDAPFDEAKLTDYDEAKKDELHYYIAAEIGTKSGEAFPKIFTIGDGKVYSEYKNMKLQQGKTYNVTQRALNHDEQSDVRLYGSSVLIAKGKVPSPKGEKKPSKQGPGAVVAAVSAVAVLLIIAVVLVVAIVIWRRRTRQSKRENQDDLDNNALNLNEIQEESPRKMSLSGDSRTNLVDESPRGARKQAGISNGAVQNSDDTDLYGNADAIRHQPIPINKFSQYVNEKRTGDNSFQQEFKTLSNGQQSSWDKARLPNNKPKNRYANIITYDHSRVLLQESIDNSDYINASYLHGYDGSERTYIATQGPIPTTVAAFWQMVWQENLRIIVMLTNLVEGGKVKCHQYWPDSREQYGPITVTLHRSDVLADYVVRIFFVSKKGEEGTMQVQHFQYTSWPDKGVPQHATSVLGFRRKVRAQYASSGGGPLLVHCSAGVGRTGAFLAVDAMLERSKKDKTIDIFNYVQLMRNNRITMVQTHEQYAFVHYAVLEALTCGNTEVSALNLNIALGKLSKPRPKDQMTGYDVEFKRLNQISPALITEESSRTGRMEENLPRNRYPDIIPLDSARVFLSIEGQNYINASFANAYREKNAFIMTQAPMINTINDFWHMIFQYKIGSVVMLNALQEGNETFPQYLPSQDSQSYGGINIELTSRETKKQLVITKCNLIHPMEPQTPHKFIHVHHTQWPDQSVPESNQSVLDLVTTVQKSQQQCGNTPIAVQCSDGVGRSGTFSAVYSLLERVKAEQVIDVFQAIKVLRLGRPNAVKTAEQYRFCYSMVQTYLDSFNDYANFSEV